jgi:hypothetical protein
MFTYASIMYSTLLILSTVRRSFQNLGKSIGMSGDTIKRKLQPSSKSCDLMRKIAQKFFANKNKIYLIIDDTLIKKPYSLSIEGSGDFFDTKSYRTVRSYKMIVGAVTDGKYTIPIDFGFVFSSELLTEYDKVESQLDYIKRFYEVAKQIFPNKTVILLADGLFTSKKNIQWCQSNGILATMRMHSNRVILYKGEKQRIDKLNDLQPKGRHMARTIQVEWHGMSIFVTAERRIDKRGNESIVYLLSTYEAKPSQHVKNYKMRWPIEKLFRTCKQSLGLQECYSTVLETQLAHVAATFFAHTKLQLDMKKQKFKTPEEAIRAAKLEKYIDVLHRFSALDQIFRGINL